MMRLQDLQGRQLGRYQITGVLGRGGMAAVYRAHDTGLRRDVALKVLYPHYGTDPSLLERFQREAIVAARLDHPNIVPIYDVGEQDGFVYIAMKLLHGRSLADRLREEPILPIDELVPIVEQIASALDYAHARGVIHRDIKAGNILLEPPDRVLLADFGIAKSLDAPGMTSTGVLIGTPDYMAPEQIANQAVDGRADIYALGVLVFRALTGRLPFEGTTEQVLLGHLHGAVPDPSMLVPSLPVAVDAVVQKALARQPAQRYAKAGEFVRDLRVALGVDMPTPPPAQRRGFEGRAVVPTVAANQYVQPRIAADEPTRRGAAAPPAARPAVASQRARPDDPTLRGTVAPSPARTAISMPAPVQRRFPTWPIILVALMLIGGGGYVLANTLRRTDNNGAAIAALTGTPTLGVPTLAPTSVQATEAATAVVVAELATAEPTSMPTAPAAPTATPNTDAATPITAPTSAPTTTPAASPAPQATARPTSAPTKTAAPTTTPTNTPQPTATPTNTAQPTNAPQPTEAPAPTAAPTKVAGISCEIPVVGGFGALLEQRVGVRQRLGCPTAPEQGGNVAEQPFEQGSMIWFAGNNTIYAFIGKNATGRHLDFPPDQQPGPDAPPSATPPPGTQAPASGFGLVWDSHADVRQQIGYATAPEAGPFAGAYQPFENGVMLFSPNGLGEGKTIYVLYNDGRLERYADPTR